MSKRFKSIVSLIVFAVMIVGMLPALPVSAAADTSAVGEVIDSFVANDKTFTLSEDSRIFVIADTEPTGELLQAVQLIGRQYQADGRPTSEAMAIVWGPESWVSDGDIVIRMDAASGVASEGYKLEVGTTAKITASDVRGLIYGANMLQKHLRYADSNSIQGFTASDVPDTVQRAVSLDCGRKYYTKDWICNFIREMSWMGYNTLQFHFSDDSGFRFDLWDEAYYQGQFQPKNDFSWICGSNYTSWTLSAYKNDADKGKYLTTAEVVEILQTAAEYHIEVIPCFDSPSHLDYMTWTFEQNYDSNPDYSFYSTYDDKTYYAADVNGVINYTNSRDWSTDLRWPYYSAVNVKGALAKAFIFELYIDIANFFKEYSGSTHMSVGADEVQLSTANISSYYSYAWGYPDFVNYINELNALLNDLGYTMRMYNDFLGSTSYGASNYTYADNIQIQYWDSPFNPSASSNTNHTEPVSYYVNEGRIIYNCIQTGTYYALRKTSAGSDARSVRNRQWTFYHANEEDIWNEWYSADISEKGDYSEDVADVPAANLGGAYFLIWCDYACVSTEKEIWNGCYDTDGSGEYYSLRDRMWSNITKQWNWDVNDTLSFSDFCTIRDAYGDHPGIGTTTDSCAQPTLLPAATQIKSGYAGGCTSYDAYGQVAVTAVSSVMSLPCDSATESTSTVLETAGHGDVYTTIGIYENTVAELWYKVITKTGVVGHILAENTRYVADLTDDITLTGANYPSGLVKGKSFSIRGDVAATRNTLTDVAVYIHSGFGVDGAVVTGSSAKVTDNSYALLNSTIDNATAFGSVPLGNHTYAISASYTSNRVVDGEVVAGTGTVYLMEKYFVVLSAAVDQSTCSHSYTETIVHAATCTTKGVKAFSCSKCGYVYEEVIPFGGHDYDSQTIGATCVEYEKVRHTCSLCGDSYDTYPDELYSDWQTTKPEGVAEELIQIKQQYHYSDYETTTSSSAALEGYTQIGTDWVASGSGSVAYVNSWPSGFLTTNSLYTQYNNKANKVTAYETNTQKLTVDSDAVVGYLWYHWCRSGYPYSVATKQGTYTRFHAFYSTTATPSNANDYDSSDNSYRVDSSTACPDCIWYWAIPVYEQKYTTYDKIYVHERWTEWSDWSDTIYTASATRKVESQTLYRYVDGTYAAHTYDENGICTLCGANCPHSYQNNICVDCGMAKPQYDYYLFGWINGANYACEEDAANLGEYKFVDGQVVVFFTEDSYVGVKASDNATYYMTDGWQGFVSSVTLYNTSKLITADKLFVPGGTEVTFTLVDNGDDTYVLSYVAVECDHASHTTEGVCTVCGDTVEHSYGTNGYCVCGLECAHEMADGKCTICGKECAHTYQNNVCTICGQAKPVYDYYLFGYINGANYACEEDYANLGEYLFVDGKLEVRFASDSYVAVKASDNAHWYMTAGWQGNVTSATLYNTGTLSNADKLFVPGGKLVTFTLVDNGDDTYVLSYEAACPHDSHSTDGVCSACGETVPHSLKDNVCTICGYEKPQYDYYLFGWINGADYADKADSANLGQYKFVDGKLTAFFTVDSYVGVKSSDNLNWYMTDGYLGQVTSATLYNAENIATEDKLFIPANKIITFTLVDNGDDTYLLSYEAADCPHESHSVDGICTLCGSTVEHSYVEGVCACGKACSHAYTNGVCSICGMGCEHNWRNGVCQICGISCSHSWTDGVCSICSVSCKHSYVEGECSTCGKLCDHSWTEGVCDTCGVRCVHTYQNNICTNCGFEKPATDYYLSGTINGEDYAWGSDAANVGGYKFVDGTLTVIFRQDSYIAVRGDKNVGWYMTDGDQGQATSVTLYNASNITDGQLLWVPGCMQITFTLVDNGDDTLTLSYTAVDCPHVSHDTDGVCADCGQTVAHSYDSVVTDPTCTEDGYTTHTCIVCGISYTDSQTAATGHSYGSVTTDPTCTQTGSIVYTCHCGDSYSETIPALGHSYESVTTDPTCTQEGKTVYTCSVCGDSYSETIAAPGHSYESVVTEPTCTETGYTTHTCCVCGDSYTDSETAALGHSWVDPSCTVEKTCSVCGATEGAALGHSYESVTTDPTCTEAGYTTHTCTVCGDSYTDGETAALGHSWVDATCTEKKTCCVCGTTEGEALGHDYDSVVTEPTCTEGGYTTHTCSVCGDSYTDSETAALDHSYEAVMTTPTCTQEGKTVYTCHRCGHSYTETIAALGHSYESVTTDPTCTEAGYTTHTCSVCGDSYTDSEVEALGHSWVDATCTEKKTCSVCGTTEGEALGHDYDSVVTEPTCTEGGYTTHTCSVCGDSYTDSETAALGHSWVDATCTEAKTCSVCGETEGEALGHDYDSVVTEPTCTETGYTTHTCTVCGDSYTDSETAALGHDYEAVTTDPTCTEDGKTVYTCAACGDSYTEVIAAPGHSYDSVVTAPTCTEEGYTTHTCTVCGDTYTDSVVAALGHSYDSVITAPTCTETGYTTHTCTVCGDTYTDSETAALGHSWVDATCTEAKTCSVCGETEGEALGHDYDSVVTQPTCTETGYTTHTCDRCGDSYTDSETAALGHSYVGVTTDPTCTEAGKTVYTCSACGDSYTETIAALGHSYETVITAPTCTEGGYTTHTCTVCGDTYTDSETDANGHSYDLTIHEATCTEYADYEYICSACGDSYIFHAEDLKDWMTEIPEGIDPSLFESKTEYRYRDYDKVVTDATSMDGYDLVGSEWIVVGSGTVYYVKDWSTGFDTTHSLYSQYDNIGDKVSAYETATNKLVIDSDEIVGHLFFHWCYASSYYSVEWKTTKYTNFCAYYDPIVDLSGLWCDTSDMSYNTGYDNCANSPWYFVDEVYGQSYTEYQKQFTYERWSDWSDWSETPVTGSETREVESRTYYRLAGVELADHDYESVVTAPTCTTDGYTTHTCTACGDSYTDSEVAALGHSYDSVTTEATCTEDGSIVYTCACGDTYTEVIEALGHSYESVTTEATCTEDGSIVYTCACGDSYTEVIDALGHSYDSVVTDPTCTEAGYTTHTCSVCGDSYTDSEVAALGHSYESVTTEATCTEDGSIVYTCACGDTYTEVIDALGHSYDSVVTDPTCTEAGYTTHTCSVCGDSYTDSEVAALGHSYESVTTEATCTEEGSIVYTCACGDTYIEVIEALGHSYDSVVTDPTCTEAGYTTHTCCVCGDSYTDSEVAALGHSYESVTTEATCTEDGSIVYTCACGDTYTEVIDALGHSYDSVVTEPTCTEAGYTTHTCSVCGDSYTDSEVAALGHSYESVTTEATCTEDGSIVYTCACGDTYTEVIDALGHSYDSVVTDPTCTEAGYTTHTCSVCGDSYTDSVVAATGHSYEDGICTGCGAEEPVTGPVLTLKYPSLSFESEIIYNIYFTAEQLDGVTEMGLITFDSELVDGTVENAVGVFSGYETDGEMYKVSTDGVAAKMMGDTLYFKVYAKLSDGTYIYTDMKNYSAVVYADTILARSTSSDHMKALVVAMLNYGAEAQLYFQYNTDALMNAGLSAEDLARVDAYDESMVADLVSVDSEKAANFVYDGSSFSRRAPSISFDSAFGINYYFTAAHTPDNGMMFYYWDLETYNSVDVLTVDNATGTVDMVLTSTEGQYWAQVSGIAAKEIDETVFVAGVYTCDGTTYTTGILAYSLGNYCETVAARVDSDQQALAQAAAVYGFYAKEHFASL